jgi:nitrous oxide reductase
LRTVEIAIIALVTASLGVGGVLAFVLSPPPSPCAGSAGQTRYITIVESLNGLNDSAHQSSPWPVATVHQCDIVSITIINQDTQTHGFSVASYSNAGIELVGGAVQKLTFQATRTGQFRMYCSSPVICTVHALMQNGLLNVT